VLGPELGGGRFHLADHRGKRAVLLAFWATFCEPCRAELADLSELAARASPDEVLVVAVATDGPDTAADVPLFVRRFDVRLPVVLDPDGRIADLYAPSRAVPAAALVGKDGRVAAVHEGYDPGARWAADAVARALGR
jgi:peroxiredoxin